MVDIRQASTDGDAKGLLRCLRRGHGRIAREFIGGRTKLTVVRRKGRQIVTIDERLHPLFSKFFVDHGSGDGLFEGVDQTAQVRK